MTNNYCTYQLQYLFFIQYLNWQLSHERDEEVNSYN